MCHGKAVSLVRWMSPVIVIAFTMIGRGTVGCTTLRVGLSGPYRTPCDTAKASHDGDVIDVAASATHVVDGCTIPRNKLTMRGIGGRARINAGGKSAQEKAI